MSHTWLLALLCYYCARCQASFTRGNNNNGWLSPHDTDVPLTSRFARSAILLAGSTTKLVWYTNVTSPYQIDLYQQNLTNPNAINTGSTAFSTTSSPGNNTYDWKVEIPAGIRADISNVFYLSLYGSEIYITTPYFNITYESALPSSSAVSSPAASSPAASSPAASSPAASSPPDNTAASQTQSRDIGLGVGLGIGIPLVIGVAYLIYRHRKHRKASSRAPEYSPVAHHAYHDGYPPAGATTQHEKLHDPSPGEMYVQPPELDGERPRYELPGK